MLANMLEWQVQLLLGVLKRYINSIGWTIAYIVGILPGVTVTKSNYL